MGRGRAAGSGMPTRLCLEPRCPHEATYRGRCRAHTRSRERATHPNSAVYKSRRWRILRAKVLFDAPFCACGCGALATDVDHIRAIEDGGDPWDTANLQPLAKACHSRKTNQEVRSR